MKKEIRTLRANEIECRIGTISKDGKGLSLLLYKDARCDMNILDETFGSMNWKRRHCRENANCIVSIWDEEKKEWVDKEDTGTESNTEAEKGLASDSFKRACVNVGIGRELYTAPFIWISAGDCEIKDVRGKLVCYDKFDVSEIEYNENREISVLVIVNEKTKKIVFSFGKKDTAPKKPAQKKTTEPASAPVDADPPAYDEEPEGETFHCRDCGDALVWTMKKDGTKMSPTEIRNLSYQRYGRVLCPRCMVKADAALKAQKESA